MKRESLVEIVNSTTIRDTPSMSGLRRRAERAACQAMIDAVEATCRPGDISGDLDYSDVMEAMEDTMTRLYPES